VKAFPTDGVRGARTGCDTSHALGPGLGLLPGSVRALEDVYERWDGRGIPDGRRGEELSLPGRVVHVAEQAVLAHAAGGTPSALAEVARRAGGHLDPDLSARFVALAGQALAPLSHHDAISAVLDAEPAPPVTVPFGSAERLAVVLARVVDLKSRWLLDPRACAAVIEASGLPRPRAELPAGLSEREVDVVRLAARGMSNREIGDELETSDRTVGHHLAHI
jgi:hypothetical protein